MRSEWTDINGARFHSRVWDGRDGAPVVVLVHGVVVSTRYMTRLGDSLAGDFTVHAPDLPGFGLTDKPDHVLDTTELAEALLDWMEGRRVESALLAANSYGCQIAAEAAATAPAKVQSLVLVGPTTDARARSPWTQMARWARGIPHEPVHDVPTTIRDLIDCGPSRAVTSLRNMCRHRIEEPLGAVKCPVVIVRGVDDYVAPEGWCKRLAALAGADLRVVPDAAHNAHSRQPEAVAAVVRELAEA